MYINKDLPPHLGGHDNETHLDNGVIDYMINKYKIEFTVYPDLKQDIHYINIRPSEILQSISISIS